MQSVNLNPLLGILGGFGFFITFDGNTTKNIGMTKNKEERFHEAMLSIYDEAKKVGVNLPKFRQMVYDLGGLEAAKRLVISNDTEGFTNLLLAGEPGLTVEALILQDEWKDLFTQSEIEKAKEKLRNYNLDK